MTTRARTPWPETNPRLPLTTPLGASLGTSATDASVEAKLEHDGEARERGAVPFRAEIATIRHVSQEVRSLADAFVVLVTLNTKPEGAASLEDDYEDFSVTSEYFSEAERRELVSGFESIGCKVDCSNGEKEFNERLVRGDFARYNRLKKVVYHSTGSGLGRSRTALMPALCQLYGLSDCSNDVYTSSLAENKVHLFNLLSFYGFPIPPTWFYDAQRGWLTGEPDRNVMLIAKPAYESASIGVAEESVSVFSEKFLRHVRELSEAMSQPILVQQFVDGYEVEVPVFDIGRPFTPMSVGVDMNGTMRAGRHFLTYEKVYDDRYDFYSFCRELPAQGASLRKIASNSFRTLGLRGAVRVDFRVGDAGNVAIIDYNNTPHLTEFHSCARAVKELGFSYGDMLCLVLYDHVRDARVL